MFDRDRGTGRTTQQLKDAPRDAWFIVCQHGALRYTADRALDLGRTDIRFNTAEAVELGALRGFSRYIVVDHNARLSERAWVDVMLARHRATAGRAAWEAWQRATTAEFAIPGWDY